MFLLALRAGLFYFLVVFSSGFMLGIIRILWVVPRFGNRAAELMEMPLMLMVNWLRVLCGFSAIGAS